MFVRSLLTLLVGAVAMVTIFWEVLAAQIDPHPVVETVWPTSVAGWIGIVMSLSTFSAILWHAIKKPGEASAKAVEDRVNVRLDKIDVSMTLLRTEAERVARSFEHGLERERAEVTGRMNRIDIAAEKHEAEMREMEKNWVQSREDRRHIAQNLLALQETIVEWRKEDRVRDDRLLEALVNLRGGKND